MDILPLIVAGVGAVASATPYRLSLNWLGQVAEVVPEPILEATASAETVLATGGTVALDIVANSPWTLAADNVRAVASQASGTGSARVTLALGPRTGGSSEVISVKVASGSLARTIQIVQ